MATFNFEDALKQLQSGKPLTGLDGILTPLIKQLTEAALQAELDQHLAEQHQVHQPEQSNRKNGYTRKTMKTSSGSFELDTPRDRQGTFEPQLVRVFKILCQRLFRFPLYHRVYPRSESTTEKSFSPN